VGNTTRKAVRNMMNKRARRTGRIRSIITLALAGIGAGMLALLAPTADASPTYPARTVTVVSQSKPEALMRAAVRRCSVAPKSARQVCWSLYIRPESSRYPSGKAVVAECIHNARVEARDWPGKGVFETYVEGCFEGNVETP
jgi:hypothetical protein